MIYLKSRDIPLKYAFNDVLVEEKNGRFDLEFEYPMIDDVYKEFKKFDIVTCNTPKLNFQDFYITDIQKTNKGVKVFAKHIFFLTSKLFCRNVQIKNGSCSSLFNSLKGCILDKNEFTFYSDIADIHTFRVENKSLYDVLLNSDFSVVKLWQGTFLRDNYSIKLLARRGVDTEYIVAKRKNIAELNVKETSDFVVTRVYLRAKKRVDKKNENEQEQWLETVVDSPLIEKYPFTFSQYREYTDSFRDVDALRKYGENLFSHFRIDLPKETFTLKCTDEINSYNLDINDTVLIYYEDFNIHKKIEVTKYSYSPMNSRYLELTFGYRTRSLADTLTLDTNKKIEETRKQVDRLADENRNAISSLTYSVEERIKDSNNIVNESIDEKIRNVLSTVSSLRDSLTERIDGINTDIDTETVKALSNAEIKAHLQSAEGRQKLIESITADVTWLKAVIVNTELLNTIVANIDLARIKRLIVDTAFIESILSKDEFRQEFENRGVSVTNIFSKLKDSITQSIQTVIDDKDRNLKTEIISLLEQKSNEIKTSISSVNTRLDNLSSDFSYNLIEGTRDFLGTWTNGYKWWNDGKYQGFTVKSNSGNWLGIGKEFIVKSGKTYTFSIYVKREVLGTVFLYINKNGSNLRLSGATNTYRNIGNEFQRIFFTFKALEDGVVFPRIEKQENTGKMSICGYCLCEGKNTSWVPHIKEIQEKFDTTEIERNISNITQRQDSITQEVSSFKEIQTTKNTKLEEDIARISTKANEITSSVESVRSSVTNATSDIDRVRNDVNNLSINQNSKNAQIDREISSIKQKSNEVTSSVTSLRNDVTTGLSQITQKSNEIDLKVEGVKSEITETEKKLGKNLCTDGSTKKTGSDLYFNLSEPMKANVEYVVEFNLLKSPAVDKVKVYQNTLSNTSKIGINKHKVKFTQDKARLNIYPVGTGGEIVDVKVYKADSLIFVKDNLDKKVDSDKVISSINLSPESAKIKAKNIELTGDVVINALNGTSTKISGNKISSGTITGSTISGGTIQGGTINGSVITGDSKIKIGQKGYLRPITTGLQINVPDSQSSNSGIGCQIVGNSSGDIPKGMFLYSTSNLTSGGSVSKTNDVILTVWGDNRMAFKYKGRIQNKGKAICTNAYMNSEITFTGINMYAISSICYGDDGELYFDDGTNGSTHGFFVKVDKTQSDERLKERILDTTYKGLDIVKRLKFKQFDWKKQRRRKRKPYTRIGLIAQDVEKIDKSLVMTDKFGVKELDDFRLLNVALKSIQELMEENKKKDEVIEDLTKRLERLEILCGK